MKIFPYVRYHARKDSRSRDGHKELDGKIFHKDDPFLKTHTPPEISITESNTYGEIIKIYL